MERRKFVIGLGALAAGGTAAVGSGAFSSVEAERTIDITTADDSDALLTIKKNEDFDGDGENYVSETEDGLLEIDASRVNREAVTTFEDLIVIENTGGQDLDLYVDVDFGDDDDPIRGNGYDNWGPVDIQRNGESIVGGNRHQTDGDTNLDAGEYAELTVEVDTRGVDDDEELEGEYQIVAE